jgi:eukaryotic-like serine/threonine-protein kinase
VSIPNAPVSVGDVLAGRYRTERLLGMGNMGVVVEATHLGLNHRVALKFLLAHRATHQALHERFLREARAASSLRSQHVTRVSDVGTLHSGAPYLVMELLEGCDLDAVLEQRGRLPVAEAVEYVLQACEAVGEAHREGIIHRDLKPANLFLTTNADGSPCVKVLDFGVSKILGEGHLKLTAEGQCVGSPLYMSPEQMQAKDVDARSDLWALGVILYELVTGKTPFDAETMLVLSTNVLLKPPRPLGDYLPDAPRGFESVLHKCLEKRPDRRWPDVAAFAAALVPFAPPRAAPYAARVAAVLGQPVDPSLSTRVLPPEVATARTAEPAANGRAPKAAATTSGGAVSHAAIPAERRRGPIVVAAGAALVALVLGSAGVMRWRTGVAATPGSAPASTAMPQRLTGGAPSVAQPSSPPPVVDPPAPAGSSVPAPSAASAKVGPAAAPLQVGVPHERVQVAKDPVSARPVSPNVDPYGGRK